MKNVMTRAWEIAKSAVVKFGGKVKEFFAESLRMAWAEIKKGADKMNIDKLVEMGATRWTEYGHDRLYLNDIAFKLSGVEYDQRKTGSFYYIKFNDERISNNKGAGIVFTLNKSYIDLKTDKLNIKSEDEFGVYAQLRAKLDELVK